MDAKTSPSPHGLHSDACSGPSNVPGPGPTQGHRPMRSLDGVGQEPARCRCPRDTPSPPRAFSSRARLGRCAVRVSSSGSQ